MRFSESDQSGGHLIQAYGAEGILINGRYFKPGLIVAPTRVQEGWGPAHPADLSLAHIDELLALADGNETQILVLGTGAVQVFPHPSIYVAITSRGIGCEVMDTGAACRTYNILMSEGRRVVAGLLPW